MQLVPINIQNKDFEKLMEIYDMAREQLVSQFETFKQALEEYCKYDVIDHITSRIKSPESIIGKMQKKNLDINYKNLIENINDISGIRIICTFKDDIKRVKELIKDVRPEEDATYYLVSTIKTLKESAYYSKETKVRACFINIDQSLSTILRISTVFSTIISESSYTTSIGIS